MLLARFASRSLLAYYLTPSVRIPSRAPHVLLGSSNLTCPCYDRSCVSTDLPPLFLHRSICVQDFQEELLFRLDRESKKDIGKCHLGKLNGASILSASIPRNSAHGGVGGNAKL